MSLGKGKTTQHKETTFNFEKGLLQRNKGEYRKSVMKQHPICCHQPLSEPTCTTHPHILPCHTLPSPSGGALLGYGLTGLHTASLFGKQRLKRPLWSYSGCVTLGVHMGPLVVWTADGREDHTHAVLFCWYSRQLSNPTAPCTHSSWVGRLSIL
jgi:hypothetical protein